MLHLVLYLSLRTGQVGFFFTHLKKKLSDLCNNFSFFQVDRARQIVKERCSAGTKLLDSGQWEELKIGLGGIGEPLRLEACEQWLDWDFGKRYHPEKIVCDSSPNPNLNQTLQWSTSSWGHGYYYQRCTLDCWHLFHQCQRKWLAHG